MNNILFNLSGKIDQKTIQALNIIKNVADSLNVPFFIVGAYARDFILKQYYGIEPPRKTMDIDLGVELESWEQFNQLTESLIATGNFSSTAQRHRFCYDIILIDIVPFGTIADGQKKISWPPEHEIFMSIAGFREAYEYSITVRLSSDPELDIKIPTLPGLALMKLIAWNDNYPERKKDAEDLLFIMQNYEEADNFNRLYEDEQGLLQEENFDNQLASIRLLGRDIARIADPNTLIAVRNILDTETVEDSHYRLIKDMLKGSSFLFEDKFDHILTLVQKLQIGINEPLKK